jgi:uncharacterized protein (TIGR03437 family)
MSRIVIALLSFLFLVPQGLRATPQVTQALLSKQAPNLSSCVVPPAATGFLTTDTAAYLWFALAGVNVGDDITVHFLTPAGQDYPSAAVDWGSEPEAGNWCYPDAALYISGHTPATLPGTWTVTISNKGSELARGYFTITASGSTGGPTVAASSDPGSVTTSPFYYTNLASLTSSPMLPNFYVNDIFGGTFTTGTNESGHAIFADTVPSTGYYSVQFQTKTPVQLTGYTLYLADDGSLHPASRSATHFTFLAGTSPGALSVISQTNLATLGSSYYQMLGVAPTNGLTPIKVTDTFAAAATYQYFELRFTPNNGTYPGVRVMELVGTGTSGTSTCTYSLNPTSASPGSGASTGSFQVTANPSTCTWTATSNAPTWLTTNSSGNGNGTVNYSVAANTSTSSRTGIITVGDKTFTVTQAGATSCSYTLSSSSNSVGAGASSNNSFNVTAATGCTWTATSNAPTWLTTSSSGNGNGTVNYAVTANTSTSSRNGTITMGDKTFTVTQAGGATVSGPSINPGGVVNQANYRAGIARGSFFSIFGSNLGPATGQQFSQFPIPDTLSGVTVTVTQGSTSVRAYMFFVRSDQINAIMPSNAPLGNVQVTVSTNSGSGSAAATVVASAFGMLGVNGVASGPGVIQNYNSATDQPINSASKPAKPGQIEIIWGTGLGAITTPDYQPPPGADMVNLPVQVWVGGTQANVVYRGRAPNYAAIDNIYFTVPNDAATGCSIPVQVSVNGTFTNTVRIAISSDGSHCQDTFNPYSGLSTTGGNSGTLGLIRVKFSGQTDPTKPPSTATLDLGFGAFAKTNPGTDFTYSPVTNLPPPGTCASSNKAFDLSAVMGDGGSSLDPTVAAALDAGTPLTVTGGAGGASGTLAQSGAGSPYMGLLGGILSGSTLPPPFLDGGPFTISGPGGKDVGAFKITVPLSPAINWTNPPSTINRGSPLTLNWTGGDSTQTVMILAGSTDQTSKASGGFLCVAPAGAHSFTVPVTSLADLVPTTAAPSSSDSSGPIGILGLMPMHLGSTQPFTAPGLNVGIVFNTTMVAQTVLVQ